MKASLLTHPLQKPFLVILQYLLPTSLTHYHSPPD